MTAAWHWDTPRNSIKYSIYKKKLTIKIAKAKEKIETNL